jgi:hypothetical protein
LAIFFNLFSSSSFSDTSGKTLFLSFFIFELISSNLFALYKDLYYRITSFGICFINAYLSISISNSSLLNELIYSTLLNDGYNFFSFFKELFEIDIDKYALIKQIPKDVIR